jgi:hypothetical protein
MLIDICQGKIIELLIDQKNTPINLENNDYYLGIMENEKYTLSTFIQYENKIYNKYRLQYYLLHGNIFEPQKKFVFKFDITDKCNNEYVKSPMLWKQLHNNRFF